MYIDKLEQVQQRPVGPPWGEAEGTGLAQPDKSRFRGPWQEPPVPTRKSSRQQSQTLHSGAQREDNNRNANKRGSGWVQGKCSSPSSQSSMGAGCPERLDSLHPWGFSQTGCVKLQRTAFGLISDHAWSRRLAKCPPEVHSNLTYTTILWLSAWLLSHFESTYGMFCFWPDSFMWELF